VDNIAGFSHDIFLGPPDALAANDTDGLPGVPEWETGVREFTWTATEEADSWEFACTVPGHYQGGMRGDMVVEQP
jgi:azurin